MKTFLKYFTALTGAFFLFTIAALAQTTPIELTFVDHLKAGMIEQDVYVEKFPGSDMVYRVMPQEREQYMDHQLFSTKEKQKHNPISAAEVGPYAKGQSLGMTLREWLSAKGTANYTCEDGWGVLNATFENLVPNAVYTMWHAFFAKPPTEPFTGILDLPLGNRDGSQSKFTTDAEGKATLEVRFENCLQLSGEQLMSLLAIAYHSDGVTYGVLPGPFGKVSHVQLFTPLPDADDIEK